MSNSKWPSKAGYFYKKGDYLAYKKQLKDAEMKEKLFKVLWALGVKSGEIRYEY